MYRYVTSHHIDYRYLNKQKYPRNRYIKQHTGTNFFQTICFSPSTVHNQALQTWPHTERPAQICKQTPAKPTWGGRQPTTGHWVHRREVSFRLAWGKEMDSKRTKSCFCSDKKLHSHHWPEPTACSEEPMESSWKCGPDNCASTGMSTAGWRPRKNRCVAALGPVICLPLSTLINTRDLTGRIAPGYRQCSFMRKHAYEHKTKKKTHTCAHAPKKLGPKGV